MDYLFDPNKIIFSQSMEEITLPIYFMPPIKSHLPLSVISSIIVANMQNWDWINNNFIQIWKLNPKTQRIHFYPIQDFSYCDQSVLEILKLDFAFFNISKDNLTEFLLNAINHNYYTVLNIDEYYVPGTRLYHIGHINHSQFIFGYNMRNRTFNIVNFEGKQGDLDIIHLSFDDLTIAFENSLITRSNLGLASDKDYDYALYLIKPMNNIKDREKYHFSMDAEVINRQLYDFLNSINSSKGDYYFTGILDGIWGLNVYDSLIENLAELNSEIDSRGLYLLYEHKTFMLNRFQKLYRMGCADDNKNELMEIQAIAEKMKLLSYKYNINKKTGEIKKIINLISTLKEKEKNLYSRHLSKYWIK